jgi:hypothetical protein
MLDSLHIIDSRYKQNGIVKENQINGCPLQSSKQLQTDSHGCYDYQLHSNGEVLFVV